MSYSGDTSDSEFGSAEEDAEFRLYEQLYFGPNEDQTEDGGKSTSPTQGLHKEKKAPKTYKNPAQPDVSELVGVRHVSEMTVLAPPDMISSAPDVHDVQNAKSDDIMYINDLEGSELTILNSNINVRTCDAKSRSVVQKTKLLPNTGHEVLFNDANLSMKRKVMSSKAVRERLSSTCSDGSIPGSVPLDGLYCSIVTSDEEEDDSIKNKLMMKDLKTNDQEENKGNGKRKPTKRKRRETSSTDDEVEDSRCSNLISAASKNASGVSENCPLEGDSNSDNDVYILPPPAAVNPEVLTLESGSESEVKVVNTDIKKVKTKNNKYQKIEKTAKSALKTKNKIGKSKGGGNRTYESETDSNDVDFPEATKGTDLTLNIDKSLSGLVKTLTKDPPLKSLTKSKKIKKRKVPKKLHHKGNQSCVDFTKGRPDTKMKPSCAKWTQSMADFYDSDISDDFDVSEIHLQQSDSPADWHLIADDYQISQRRRYYNAPKRCRICKQDGHTTKECTHVPACHLCSGRDHSSRNKCPENCCFKCGQEPHYFCPRMGRKLTCFLCGYLGHHKDLCPDLWRRFHLTTSGMVAQTPSEYITRPPKDQYCCSCAKRGHFGHECPLKYYNVAYTQVPQSVVSYSRPVNLVGGYFVVNIEGAQSPVAEKNVTKMFIKLEESGRIIGKKGVVVQAINKKSGAHVNVLRDKRPQVLICGSSESRQAACEIIKALLGHERSEQYADFVQYLKRTEQQSLAPVGGTTFTAADHSGSTPTIPSTTTRTHVTADTSDTICTPGTISANTPTARAASASGPTARTASAGGPTARAGGPTARATSAPMARTASASAPTARTASASAPTARTASASAPTAGTASASAPTAGTASASTPTARSASTLLARTTSASTPTARTTSASTCTAGSANTPTARTASASTPTARTASASTCTAGSASTPTAGSASTPTARTTSASTPTAGSASTPTARTASAGTCTAGSASTPMAKTTSASTLTTGTAGANTLTTGTASASTPSAATTSASTPTVTTTSASTPTATTTSASTPTAATTSASTPTAATTSASTPTAATTSASTPTSNSRQTSWREQFLTGLDRRKGSVLKELKDMANFLADEKCIDLGYSMKKLKLFRKKRKVKPSTQLSASVKEHLKNIVINVIGKQRYGEGNEIHAEMMTLLKKVKVCRSSTIPDKICVQIANTLECLHEPPIEKLDQLLQYAEMYQNAYKLKRGTESKITNIINLALSNENIKQVRKANKQKNKRKK